MGFLPVGASAIAAMLSYGHSDLKVMWIAISAGIISLWTYGIMHNLAVEAARRRSSYRGGFGDFIPKDLHLVPTGLTLANMASSIVSFCALVAAVVRSL